MIRITSASMGIALTTFVLVAFREIVNERHQNDFI